MRHTITEQELEDWLRKPQWRNFAASMGKATNKRLEVDASGSGHVFRVTDHGETVFLGADRSAAVAAYNAAR